MVEDLHHFYYTYYLGVQAKFCSYRYINIILITAAIFERKYVILISLFMRYLVAKKDGEVFTQWESMKKSRLQKRLFFQIQLLEPNKAVVQIN